MEDWQKDHVRKHLVQLIKATKCSDDLIAKLKLSLVLSQEDVEELSRLTQLQKSKRMYEILQARLGVFEILQNSLKETGQDGALKILQDRESDDCAIGPIKFDRKIVLGTGKMGLATKAKVFAGTFGNSQMEVAVKELNTMFIDKEVVVQSVEGLIKLQRHENVASYHGVQFDSLQNSILVASDLGFITLQDEVKLDLLSVDKRTILKGCTKGLDHLHNKLKILHKNLKPSNVLLGSNGRVKLTDFGLPKGISSFVVVGAADWMPPEISRYLAKNEGSDDEIETMFSKKTDIFSLGCIYYFALTNGLHPFGKSFSIQHNIIQYHPNIANPNVNDEWKKLIEGMIAEEPEDRLLVEDILTTGATSQLFTVVDQDRDLSTTVEVAEQPQPSTSHQMTTRPTKRKSNDVGVVADKNQKLPRASTSGGMGERLSSRVNCGEPTLECASGKKS